MSTVPSTFRQVDAETRSAIEGLIAEYHWRLDHGHADTLHELVTENYTSQGPMGLMEGREAIKAWGARRVTQDAGVSRHFTGGTRLWFDGDVLRGVTYYQTFRSTLADPTHPASVGEFHQSFAQEDGEWKVASRDVVTLFGGAAAAAHAATVTGGGER